MTANAKKETKNRTSFHNKLDMKKLILYQQ